MLANVRDGDAAGLWGAAAQTPWRGRSWSWRARRRGRDRPDSCVKIRTLLPICKMAIVKFDGLEVKGRGGEGCIRIVVLIFSLTKKT